MKTIILIMTLMIPLLAMPGAFAKRSHDPSQAFIAQQFDIWNAALKTGNAEKVAALYCESGGMLIPTVSNKVRTNRQDIADYFVHFLQLKPVGQIDKSYIRILGPNTAVDSGLYTFHIVKDGRHEDVHARYTYVYQQQHGKWCIMVHHSSVLPESEPAPQH